MKRRLFLEGARDGIPICLGYFSVSIAYGMAAVLSGLSVTQVIMISLSNLTSAGQFAGTELLAAGANFLELALTMIIINSRYFLMAISLSQKVDPSLSFPDRLLISYGITDEIYAVEISRKGTLQFWYMTGLIVTSAAGWVAGTACGALASNLLPFEVANNLGIALYAMFIAIIVPKSRDEKPVLLAVCLSIALSLLFAFVPGLSSLSSGYTIIIITILVSALMAVWFPVKEEEDES